MAGSPSTLCAMSIGGVTVPITGGSVSGLHEPILDQGLRGVAAKDFGSYKGPFRAEVSAEGLANAAIIDQLATSIIGAAGSLSATPARLATALSCGGIGMSATECGVTELTIRFNRSEGAVTYSTSMLGWEVSTANVSALTAEIKPLVGWITTISIGSVAGCVIEGEVSLSREWALLYCGGDQYASNSFAGGLECTARFTVEFDTSADATLALDHTKVAVTVTLNDEDSGDAVAIAMPEFYLSDGPVEIDSSGIYATLVFSGRAVYMDGDGPVSIT